MNILELVVTLRNGDEHVEYTAPDLPQHVMFADKLALMLCSRSDVASVNLNHIPAHAAVYGRRKGRGSKGTTRGRMPGWVTI